MSAERLDPSVDGIAEAALQEIAAPTLAITAQFFEVHTLAADPLVRVEQDAESPDGWHVFLRLRGVPYYWCCTVEMGAESLHATWGFDIEDVHAYLRIDSDTMRPDEIEARIGLPATTQFRIGEPRSPRPGSPLATWHRYTFSSPAPEASGIDRSLEALFARLEPHADAFAAVTGERAEGSLTVCYSGWQSSMGGVRLTPEQATLLGRMGLALDVDLYAEGPAVPD